MKKYDSIILGAGLAGLSCGLKLAKEGQKVLVLEKHNRVGGLAKNFERKGILFDGLHMMEGYSKGTLQYNIFKDLGILKNVPLVKINTFFYLHYFDKPSFVMSANPDLAKEELLSRFPDEEEGISYLWDIIKKLKEEHQHYLLRDENIHPSNILFKILFPTLFEFSDKTLFEVIDPLFTDEFIKVVFGCNLHFLGSSDREISFVYYILGIAHYIYDGGYYIKGSSQVLSDYLSHEIQKYGGEVSLRSEVVELIEDKDKIAGVRALSIAQKEQVSSFYADNIVVNFSPQILINKIYPKFNKMNWGRRLNSLKVGPTLTQIHLAFKEGDTCRDDQQYMHHIVLENVEKGEHLLEKDILDTHSFSFIDYRKIDSGVCNSGNITIHDYESSWVGLSKHDYNEKKKVVAENYINILNKYIPGIKKQISFFEVTTPLTIKRFTGSFMGAFNGFEQTVELRNLNPISCKTPIENVYLASQWISPGGGYPSTITGGYKTALCLLKKTSHL